MKIKNYFFTLMMLFLTSYIYGQKIGNGCGVNLSIKDQRAFKKATSKIKKERVFQNILSRTSQSRGVGLLSKPSVTYKIPVVFHILHNGEGDGPNNKNEISKEIMACKIADAVNVANKDFRGEYPEFNATDPRFDGVKDKLDNIEFILAKEDPDGNLLEAPGMNWKADGDLISWGYDKRITDDPWWWGKNGKYYLQVFIVHYPNQNGKWNQSGHAFLPNGPHEDAFPRIVYNWRYIGTTSACGDKGIYGGPNFEKIFSHEIGHYFGLSHVFAPQVDGEPVCADGDGLEDTPDTLGSEGCNRDVENICGTFPNLENHMDYNTACQNMFTKQQVALMKYWLDDTSEVKHPRGLLWQPNNLKATGIVPDIPEAKFESDLTSLCNNQSIKFKDVSNGLPTSRVWTFEGGTPATSIEANPTVTYATAGKFKVTLKVTNSLGEDTIQVMRYVDVDQRSTAALSEDFEGVFPPKGWDVYNPDNELAWSKRSDAGHGDSSSMVMDNSNNNILGAKDYIRLPYFDFTSSNRSQMYFDVAYTKFDDSSPDVLKVQVSTDCGVTWNDAYSKTHTELETTEVITGNSNGWIPSKDEHWRKDILDLSAYDGNPNVAIRFSNTSGYGTRVWIDNVNIVLDNDNVPTSDFYSRERSTICNSLDVTFKDVSTGNPTSWLWTFEGGTPTTSTSQNPPVISYTQKGSHKVTLTTSNANGSNTVTKSDYITIVIPNDNSFSEDFSGTFPPAGWDLNNPDDFLGWEKRSDIGRGDNSCMIMNNADNENLGEIDEITLQPMDLSTGNTDFSFDVAYTKFDNDSPDVLKVLVSKDCGVSWKEVYSKTHIELETFGPAAKPNDWKPTEDSHWRTERILLDEFKGEVNVLIKFHNVSGYGTRIWIDNVKFNFNSQETPVSDFSVNENICNNVPVTFTDHSTGSPTSWLWTFNGGTPSTSTDQNPVITYETPGVYDVTLVATNGFGTGTITIKNDFITIGSTATLPLTENFEGTFPIEGWKIINTDKDEILWEKRSDVGNGDSSCLVINNADNPEDMIDELIVNPLDFESVEPEYLKFDIAYTKYDNAEVDGVEESADRLEILISTDCGVTWTNVYNKTHTDLETVEVLDDPTTIGVNETNDWIPTERSHWREEVIELASFANQPSVLIKFKNTSGYGTRIWIDNLNVTGKATIRPDYCAANGQNGIEAITNVSFANIDNASGRNSSGYESFIDKVANVNKASSYNLTVDIEGYRGGTPDEIYAWFDWNRDGDFDDADEYIPLVKTSGTKGEISVTVPQDAVSGNTGMRIRVAYYPNSNIACGSVKYGEVEDYTLNISSLENIDNDEIPNDNASTFKSLSVSPNPNSGHGFNVNFNSPETGLVKIQLYNPMGVRVFELHENKGSELSKNIKMNQKLASGLYILKVEMKSITKTLRIVIE